MAVITNLCILKPDPVTRELTVTSLHPGVTGEQVRAATGWDIRFANDVTTTDAPTDREVTVLRDLLKRTAAAHGAA
jgi:glutaconate CoA-transferase subunit B